MSAPTKFCLGCGLEAPLPVLLGAILPACAVCGGRQYVEAGDMPWELRIDNEHDRVFLKVNRIAST